MSKSQKSKISITNLGGYHPNPALQIWPMGSIFENEGQRLYDLVRKLKPLLIVEIGGYYGCSTSWLAKAVRDNKKGKVISIDNNENHGGWSMIPKELEQFIKFVAEDALKCDVPKNIDMVFEDGSHAPSFTKNIALRFKPSKVFVSHDYMHRSEVGRNVKADFNEVFGEPDEIFFEAPTNCGLAIKFIK